MDHRVTRSSIDPPPPAPRISVDAEASLMNRGTMRNFSYVVAGGLLLGAVTFLLVQHVGRSDVYSTAAASTAQIGREQFNGFFGCALPGSRASELNAPRVQTALERLGDGQGKNYQRTLAECLPHMHALTNSVQALSVPKDLQAKRAALINATSEIAAVNSAYLAYLNDDTKPYHYVSAMKLQERFGASWASYRTAEGELQKAIEQRL
jgi:hypothetical protein